MKLVMLADIQTLLVRFLPPGFLVESRRLLKTDFKTGRAGGR